MSTPGDERVSKPTQATGEASTMPSSKIGASPESNSPGAVLPLNKYVQKYLLTPQSFLHQTKYPLTLPSKMPTSSVDFSVPPPKASSGAHLSMGEIAATLPSQDVGHQNTLPKTAAENGDFSVQHGNTSSEILKNMADMALTAAADNIASGSLSQTRDVGSKPLTFNNSLPNTSPIKAVLPTASAISPPNPFRAGRIKIKHNMSPEEVKASIARERLAAAAPNERRPGRPAHHHSEKSTSSSATIKNTKLAANVEKQSIFNAEKEEDVKTIYNPDAGKIPIRIYVSGEDPTYVEPAPLQWNKNSAAKWEKEKADFVKIGLTKIKEFGGEDRNCVYYYEWVARGPNKEKINQWILFREKGEGRSTTNKKRGREAM